MDRFEELWDGFLADTLNQDEVKEFLELIEKNDARLPAAIETLLIDGIFSDQPDQKKEELIFQKTMERAGKLKSPIRPVISIWKLAAAAVVLFVVCGVWFVLNKKSGVSTPQVPQIAKNDVKAPESNRAMITLSSGQRVYLDSVNSGQLAMQGKVKLVKLANGEIAYQTEDETVATEVAYNTLTNPRGSSVAAMTLVDGSKVWLNAGSSITYPVAFAGSERKVSITGEAYFEVAHNAAMPFKVKKDDIEVTVLGTHFNINAYDDEASVKVTLLEGSVEVSAKSTVLMKPGQQALIAENRNPEIRNNANTDEVIAWKQGEFHFESADLKTILREFSRWYDIEVIYEGKVSDEKYFSIVSRNTSLKDVLKSLQANDIKFRIEDKKLYVVRG